MFAGPIEWGTGSSAYSITHATRTRLLYTDTYLFTIGRKAPSSRSSNTGQRPDNSSGSAATVSASRIQHCITEKKPAGDSTISAA